MIVNNIENGWEIIYHRAHALLAAQLAGHCLTESRPPRWVETIATISHHDDLEKEWEGNHLTKAGAPMDFTMEKFSLENLSKIIDESKYRGRWVALLSSMHVCFLSEPLRDQVPKLAEFLDKEYEQHKRWRKELNVKKEDMEKAYAFMQWCDRLSLILCQRELPTRERSLEISKGADGKRHDIMQRQDGTLNVSPWCFLLDRFIVTVDATYLNQLEFENNDELITVLKTASVKELSWEFVKS